MRMTRKMQIAITLSLATVGLALTKPPVAQAQELANPLQLAGNVLVLAWTAAGWAVMTAANAVQQGFTSVYRADSRSAVVMKCWRGGDPLSQPPIVVENWGTNALGCERHISGLMNNPKYARDRGYPTNMRCHCLAQ